MSLSAQVQIQRDVRIPKLNTFNPADVPEIWAEMSQSPTPGNAITIAGIDDNLRLKIDGQARAENPCEKDIAKKKNQRARNRQIDNQSNNRK